MIRKVGFGLAKGMTPLAAVGYRQSKSPNFDRDNLDSMYRHRDRMADVVAVAGVHFVSELVLVELFLDHSVDEDPNSQIRQNSWCLSQLPLRVKHDPTLVNLLHC